MGNTMAGALTAISLMVGVTSPSYPFASDEIRFTEERTQKPVILDMDFSSDVDDACALRLAINADVVGEISLKAVTMSVKEPNDLNLKAADGILDYQHLKNVKLGYTESGVYDESPYWEVCSMYSDGQYEVDTAVRTWRSVIAESDRNVDIVTTGYLMNLEAFCKSQPDDISDMSGMEMLEEKVGNIYITGGTWTTGFDNNFYFFQETRQSMDWLLHNVTRPMFFITNDTGGPVIVGSRVTREYPDDPVSKALLAFGTDSGRFGWDPMVMYICMSVDSIEQAEERGFAIMPVSLDFNVESGENHFYEVEASNFYRLYRTNQDLEYYKNLLDEWCLVK